MKKLILAAGALLSFGLANAQSQGWSSTGARDDFEGANDYSLGANLQGLYWWENTGGTTIVKTRAGAVGSGYMNLALTNAGDCNAQTPACYPVFGCDFGTDGNSNKYSVDLSSNANIVIQVENMNASQDTYITIELEDINGKKASIEPNVADVNSGVTWGTAGNPRKGRNGFTLLPSESKTVTIDLSSVPGAVGGLSQYFVAPATHGYSCATPYDCPSTSYQIDITQIVGVIFTINFGQDNIFITEGDNDPTADTFIDGSTIQAFTGSVRFHNFTIGTFATSKTDALVEKTLMVYPNPADDAVSVEFQATGETQVSLMDVLGNTLRTETVGNGAAKLNLNTSDLTSGLYMLNVSSESGTVTRKVSIK